ncbi:Coiled-coil domain-containing protein 47 [Cyanidiococcus yangmingshanensis]|uniref:Coiled-coil domain-containing protein 47 n=1 Tax=Cyanidiococcus yangmingshanensis TaxID=2690220 RepID=A0A7J7IP04_9RHOD|nr:Coiled-coil domain-containing protein 47 [Cyanidiococcus yangmingshanensis]
MSVDQSPGEKANRGFAPVGNQGDYGSVPSRAEKVTRALCLIYAFALILGWLFKYHLIRRWKRVIEKELREQCAAVGEDLVRLAGGHAAASAAALVPDVWKRADDGILELYASGRRYLAGVLVRIDPVPREDLFTVIHDFLFQETPDRLSIKAFISTNMERCVFALAKRYELKSLHVSYRELERYTEQVTGVVAGLDAEYGVVADTKELAQRILSPRRVAFLNQHPDLVQRLRVSDIYEHDPQDDDQDGSEPVREPVAGFERGRSPSGTLRPDEWPQVIYLQATLPTSSQVLSELLRFFFDLVDDVGTLRLSTEAQHATLALREFVQREEQKRRNKERAKEEKERAEERIARLDDVERRRRERREQRKRAKGQRAPLRIFL